MTFTNKNKNFKYTVSLDTSKDIFKVFLANDPAVYGLGRTIEEAMHNLEELAYELIAMDDYSRDGIYFHTFK